MPPADIYPIIPRTDVACVVMMVFWCFPVGVDAQDLVLDVITQLWIDLRHTRQSRLELIQVRGVGVAVVVRC